MKSKSVSFGQDPGGLKKKRREERKKEKFRIVVF